MALALWLVCALTVNSSPPPRRPSPGAQRGLTAEAAALARATPLALRGPGVGPDRIPSGEEPPRGSPRTQSEPGEGCPLGQRGAEPASTSDCLRCHQGGPSGPQLHTTHPVDVDLEVARFRSVGSMIPLRPAAEVIRQGLFLPEGKVSCLTCHDGRSPWRYYLVVPPDAEVRAPVKPEDPETYDPVRLSASRALRLSAADAQRVLPAGTEVSSTPLCKVCHVFD